MLFSVEIMGRNTSWEMFCTKHSSICNGSKNFLEFALVWSFVEDF